MAGLMFRIVNTQHTCKHTWNNTGLDYQLVKAANCPGTPETPGTLKPKVT